MCAEQTNEQNVVQDDTNFISELIEACDNVIIIRESVVASLEALIEPLRKRRLGYNVAKSVGAAASIVGTGLLFTPAALFGVGLLGVGTVGSLATSISDYRGSKTAREGIEGLLQSEMKYSKRLEQLIQDFEEFVKEIAKETDLESVEVTGALLKGFANGSLKIAHGAVVVAATSIPASSGKVTSVFIRASLKTRHLAPKTVGALSGVKAIGHTFLKTLGPVLGVVSIGWEIYDLVRSWIGEDTNVKMLEEVIVKFKDSVSKLLEFKAAISPQNLQASYEDQNHEEIPGATCGEFQEKGSGVEFSDELQTNGVEVVNLNLPD